MKSGEEIDITRSAPRLALAGQLLNFYVLTFNTAIAKLLATTRNRTNRLIRQPASHLLVTEVMLSSTFAFLAEAGTRIHNENCYYHHRV